MTIQDIFRGITERLQSSANVSTVYGEPISAEGKTIIPVARVRYGFGGGAGSLGAMEHRVESGGPQEMGGGGGGGGGVEVTPVGIIEVTAGDTRFISFGERRRIVQTSIFGLLAAIFLLRRRRRG